MTMKPRHVSLLGEYCIMYKFHSKLYNCLTGCYWRVAKSYRTHHIIAAMFRIVFTCILCYPKQCPNILHLHGGKNTNIFKLAHSGPSLAFKLLSSWYQSDLTKEAQISSCSCGASCIQTDRQTHRGV